MARITKKINAKLGPWFYKIAEKSSQVYWLRSVDFQQQLYVSPAFETLWPVSCKQLYAKPSLWMSAILEGDRDRICQQFIEWQARAMVDRVTQINYRIRSRSGEILYIEDRALPIFDEGSCIAFVGVTTDVTAHRQSGLEADSAAKFFRFLIEKSDSVFWVTDPSGEKQVYVNSAYEKVWQRTVASRVEEPSSWYQSVVKEDRAKACCPANIKAKPEGVHSSLYRITTPQGEVRWIKGKGFALRAEDNQLLGYAGIEDDVTVDVLREQKLCEAKKSVERANQAKSDFLAMMSHELRTPLNAILGLSQTLRASRLTRTQEGQIDVITQASNNLLALFNDILGFTKLEVGKFELT